VETTHTHTAKRKKKIVVPTTICLLRSNILIKSRRVGS